MDNLIVKAQGMFITTDDRLMFVTQVTDMEGKPILGLKKSNFSLWQFGHLFGQPNIDTVVPLEEIDELKGYYHLVSKLWAPAVNGTFAFRIGVKKLKPSRTHSIVLNGHAMAWVVKVDGGP